MILLAEYLRRAVTSLVKDRLEEWSEQLQLLFITVGYYNFAVL